MRSILHYRVSVVSLIVLVPMHWLRHTPEYADHHAARRTPVRQHKFSFRYDVLSLNGVLLILKSCQSIYLLREL